jgi:hypothetical protein
VEENPWLIGYYRLLMGYSQKEFYHKGGLGRFSAMEEKGVVPEKVRGEIGSLCRAFCERGSELLEGLGIDRVSDSLLDELTLLTLGPQLRGSNNTKIGKAASLAVFEIIERAVGHAVVEKNATKLVLKNAAKREVSIAFSSDPDIKIVELVTPESQRNIVAIEIKGGADRSNIWNRLGEAEKSHQSAKQREFVEFWTIYNLRSLDMSKAREKSPTTNRFYSLPELQEGKSMEFKDFRDRLISLVGIRTKGRPKR